MARRRAKLSLFGTVTDAGCGPNLKLVAPVSRGRNEIGKFYSLARLRVRFVRLRVRSTCSTCSAAGFYSRCCVKIFRFRQRRILTELLLAAWSAIIALSNEDRFLVFCLVSPNNGIQSTTNVLCLRLTVSLESLGPVDPIYAFSFWLSDRPVSHTALLRALDRFNRRIFSY